MKKEQYLLEFEIDRKNIKCLTQNDIKNIILQYIKEKNIDKNSVKHVNVRTIHEC